MTKKLFLMLVALGVLAWTSPAWAQKKADPNHPDALKQNVVKVLRTSNKAQVNRYVPKVYEFKNVNPGSFAHRLLADFIAVEEGILDTYVAPDGKSGLVLVVVPEYQLEAVDKLMAQMDRPELTSSSGTKWAYLALKNRSVLDGEVPVSLLQYASADTAIFPDVETNSVFLTGSPSGVDATIEASRNYDIVTPEVAVTAKIYEVQVTNDGSLGLDYVAWKNGPGRALFTLGAFGEYAKVDSGRGVNNGVQFDPGANVFGLPGRSMHNYGYNASYLWDVPSAFFDFLTVKGKARMVTEANATVLSGSTATFASGEQILYYRVQDPPQTSEQIINRSDILPVAPGQSLLNTGTVNDRQVVGATVPRRSQGVERTGIFLEVTPTISVENVDLRIYTEVADLVGFDDKGVPMIASREVDTDVRAKDGEEVVLGGLTRDSSIRTTRKIPILGSIPVLGWLFGGEISSKQVTSVVEVVTPQCVEGCGGLTRMQKETIMRVKGELNVEYGVDEYGFGQIWLDRDQARPKYRE